jgi:hypothetical protein
MNDFDEPTGSFARPRRRAKNLGIFRWMAGVVGVLFGIAVILYAAGVGPKKEIPEEIRFYLDRGANPTQSELDRAAQLVELTREGLARYRDPEAARDDGYFNSTPGVGGVNHWINLEYMRDGRILDPERPENLMYYRTTSGKDILVGAMFVMQGPGELGPAVGGEMTRWHLHPGYCWAPAGFPVSPSANEGNRCPPGQFLADTPEMIHVWVVPNPHGVFAEEMDLELPPE